MVLALHTGDHWLHLDDATLIDIVEARQKCCFQVPVLRRTAPLAGPRQPPEQTPGEQRGDLLHPGRQLLQRLSAPDAAGRQHGGRHVQRVRAVPGEVPHGAAQHRGRARAQEEGGVPGWCRLPARQRLPYGTRRWE